MKLLNFLKFSGIVFLLTLMCTHFSTSVQAQSCGCAGAPIISAQDMASSRKGQLHLGLTYEYHDISLLYAGDDKLNNRSFERSTQSLLFEINYGLTDRLLISGLISSTRKLRETGSSLQNRAETQGIGGSLIMLKYNLHQNVITDQYQLTVGAGAKVPLGPNDISGDITTYAPDMQPSTGALDVIGWLHFSKTYLPQSTINTFATISYRRTGTSDFVNRPNYKFGNQFITKVGLSNQITSKLKYSFLGKYRRIARFEFQGSDLPNTGGYWINVVPGINYKFTPSLNARISGEIPLYRNLNGTQATTRYSAQISLFYTF